MVSLLEGSLYFSLFVQIITIGIGLYGLMLRVQPGDAILKSAVGLETLVSAIQLSFYSWYAYHFREVSTAIFYRYHDWVFTTPIMLFTTVLYYDYNNTPEDETKTVKSVWEKYRTEILLVFGFNLMMLVFGYLYELNILDLFTSNTMGFIGLIGSFYILYDSFVSKNLPANLPLFAFMSIVWGLYGVAATFEPRTKSIFYNLIDTVSKNFYSVFLTYVLFMKSKTN